ncbi:hypothetical protein LTR86_011171 [Recurvomyces mirabilis]|nr:hypothetical protein LTR86_011171 [Recurvomyces mirabilis]
MGLPGRNYLFPPYHINNFAGNLSSATINTDLVHANGLVEYDIHDLYGTMISAASRVSMENRRPGRRPLVITRSTFAGAGRQVGHWLGDNVADWSHYLISIAELMEFAALFQIPMVGSDVCGFAGPANELLCARLATLEAAKNAIGARYQLLDYIYTAMYNQNQTGAPTINPLFFAYPNDVNTFPTQYQYLYGNSILVSPVTEENSTTTSIYLPKDIFYDFWTDEVVQGRGAFLTLNNVSYTTIPLHYKGGSIVPLRTNSANTTAELRKQSFIIIVAPGTNGTASGSLYLDEGDATNQFGHLQYPVQLPKRTLSHVRPVRLQRGREHRGHHRARPHRRHAEGQHSAHRAIQRMWMDSAV